jgi:hypothetical protein
MNSERRTLMTGRTKFAVTLSDGFLLMLKRSTPMIEEMPSRRCDKGDCFLVI